MTEPSFIISRDDRDPEGKLSPEQLARIVAVLQAPGFVLLPSDTAYSIATWLNTAEIRDDINRMLERDDQPISLAFPSPGDLLAQWVEPSRIAEALLETFTPGPITVVCRASRLIPDEIVEEAWRSQNRTLGVRIPDSVEERQVAEAGGVPITTVAVRDLENRVDGIIPGVTSFDRAMEIVRRGMDAIGGRPWCAVEGEINSSGVTSTVVEVLDDSGMIRMVRDELSREGEIRACIAAALAVEPQA